MSRGRGRRARRRDGTRSRRAGEPYRRLHLAAYDVRDPTRLRGALQVVREYATGGQKSVYECFLTPAERAALIADMAALLAPEDSFMLVRLDPRMQVRTLGVGRAPSDGSFFWYG